MVKEKPDIKDYINPSVVNLVIIWVMISHSMLMWYVVYKEFPELHHNLYTLLQAGHYVTELMLWVFVAETIFLLALYFFRLRLYRRK